MPHCSLTANAMYQILWNSVSNF